MDLKSGLLEERSRILRELADVERLLLSRYKWVPPKTESSKGGDSADETNDFLDDPDLYPVDPVVETGGRQSPIRYSREAEYWLDEVSSIFTVKDFKRHLEMKYGAGAINEHSIRGPFSRLESSGKIIPVKQGSGRSPTIYRKA